MFCIMECQSSCPWHSAGMDFIQHKDKETISSSELIRDIESRIGEEQTAENIVR